MSFFAWFTHCTVTHVQFSVAIKSNILSWATQIKLHVASFVFQYSMQAVHFLMFSHFALCLGLHILYCCPHIVCKMLVTYFIWLPFRVLKLPVVRVNIWNLFNIIHFFPTLAKPCFYYNYVRGGTDLAIFSGNASPEVCQVLILQLSL